MQGRRGDEIKRAVGVHIRMHVGMHGLFCTVCFAPSGCHSQTRVHVAAVRLQHVAEIGLKLLGKRGGLDPTKARPS